jgi:hypothetical protein
MSEPTEPRAERREAIKAAMVAAAPSIGNHQHHPDCIHNLSPEDQIKARGRTVEQWMRWHDSMPVQITPDDWQIETPEWVKEFGERLGASRERKDENR